MLPNEQTPKTIAKMYLSPLQSLSEKNVTRTEFLVLLTDFKRVGGYYLPRDRQGTLGIIIRGEYLIILLLLLLLLS